MQIYAFEAKSEMNKKNGKRTWEKEEEEDRKKRKNETYGLAVWLLEWVGMGGSVGPWAPLSHSH